MKIIINQLSFKKYKFKAVENIASRSLMGFSDAINTRSKITSKQLTILLHLTFE